MSMTMIRKVETEIVGRFIDDALAAGYRLAVSLERGYDVADMEERGMLGCTDRDKIMAEAFAGDDCHIFVQSADGPTVENDGILSEGWVRLVLGNDGWDVISDYSTGLEDIGLMAGALAVSKAYE